MWLNNPRRPQEACGTSGMKSALNGGLNLSILDGWWDEAFDGENGWAITSAEHDEDLERRDEVEAGSLFELLERQVVPLFYERWQGPVPRRWVQRVKRSLDHARPVRHRGPHGARLHRAALRAHRRGRATPCAADGHGRGPRPGRLEAAGARRGGPASTSTTSTSTASVAELGTERTVEAVVSPRRPGPGDVEVQLIHGPVGQGGELAETTIVPMDRPGPPTTATSATPAPSPASRPAATASPCASSLTTTDLVTPVELGLIA